MQNKPIFERNEYLLWSILFAALLVFVLIVGSVDPIARNFSALLFLAASIVFGALAFQHYRNNKGN